MPGLLQKLMNTARVAAWSQRDVRIPYMAPEALGDLQALRVQRLLAHAWEHVPFYRDWMRGAGAGPGDIRDAADLARLPTIDKLELALHSDRFTAPHYHAGDGITLSSSGTSGRHRLLRYDARAVLKALASGRRQRLALAECIGREAGYREAVFNREGSVSTQIRSFVEARTLIPRRIELKRRIFSPTRPFQELLAGINEFEPDVVRGYGSHLGAFFRWLRDSGKRLHKPRAVTYGADSMSAADRLLIESEFEVPVLSTYQAVEALRIGFECPARRGFHISVDQVAIRAVDVDGSQVSAGERGELVLTNLTNYATPVINYRLGDHVTLGSGPCPCGRTLPLLTSIDGRADDLVVRRDGTQIHALTLLAPLQAVSGVVRIQIEQRDVDEFLLRVVWAGKEYVDEAELMRRMKSVLTGTVTVRIEPVDQIPSTAAGKVKSLISRVTAP